VKHCSKCNVGKPNEMFSFSKANKDGLHRWCKDCAKVAKKEWYIKNAESERTKAMQYHYENYEKNKERIIKNVSKWQKINREKYRKIAKKCYENTKHKKFAWQALARAAKRNAVPKWIDSQLKQEIQNSIVRSLTSSITGAMTEDYNIVLSRSGVATGANSVTTFNFLQYGDYLTQNGILAYSQFAPASTVFSQLVGYGTATDAPTTDYFGNAYVTPLMIRLLNRKLSFDVAVIPAVTPVFDLSPTLLM